jgi:hypothetical protein
MNTPKGFFSLDKDFLLSVRTELAMIEAVPCSVSTYKLGLSV